MEEGMATGVSESTDVIGTVTTEVKSETKGSLIKSVSSFSQENCLQSSEDPTYLEIVTQIPEGVRLEVNGRVK